MSPPLQSFSGRFFVPFATWKPRGYLMVQEGPAKDLFRNYRCERRLAV